MVIYMTTNLVNNKKYIGIDSKNDPNYLGSGLYLKKAFKKYGKKNFKKEILEICLDKESLLIKEKEWIVKFDAVNSKEFYNIHEGGIGGDIRHFIGEDKIEKWKSNISNGKKGLKKGVPLSESNRKGISEGLKKFYKNGGTSKRQGVKLSEEVKQKISDSNKGKVFTKKHLDNLKKSFEGRDYNGNKNPFYGCGDKIKGDKNPMYGKSFYDIWLEKYGKKIADLKMEEWKQKRRKK